MRSFVVSVSVLGAQWAAIAVLAALIHAPLAAQAWTQVSTTGPSGRSGHAMAYDSQRGRTVLFGGANRVRLGDTWEWDGGTWTRMATVGPSSRHSSAMAYDSQRGRTVLFGGSDGNFPPAGDTWEWDGANWTQVASSGPPRRNAHALAYDSQRGKVVLFGGATANGLVGDTWEWNGITWTQAASSGPPARSEHAMAYDSQRGRTVLFGGAGLGDTWEWDGGSWTLVASTGPGARRFPRMTYDSQRGKTVLFGGAFPIRTYFGDTWEWDGSAWTQVAATGPSPRREHGMAYDSQRGRTVLFGGWTSSGSVGDTWEIPGGAAFSNYGAGCPGSLFTVSPCGELNPTGGTLAGTLAPLEFGILVSAGSIHVESFDVFTQSTGGTQVVPAHIYPSFLSATPLASTTMTVGPTPDFYTATFPTPVPVGGSFLIAIDVSSQTVVVPNLTTGSTGTVISRTPPTGSWAPSASTNRPAWRVDCVEGTQYLTPSLGNVGNPVLGTAYDITLSDALPSTGAIIMTGFSDSVFNGIPLPAPLPNAPGCDLLAAADATLFMFTSATGTATYSLAVPNSTSYIGVELFHQWAVFDAVNPLGIIVSDAGKARLGT